eukprot:7013413-Pyramimonas_sp.AAC.1
MSVCRSSSAFTWSGRAVPTGGSFGGTSWRRCCSPRRAGPSSRRRPRCVGGQGRPTGSTGPRRTRRR